MVAITVYQGSPTASLRISLRMAGAPSSFSTQLCTTCSSCALAQVGTFHCAQVVILYFAFCILFFFQVDVFHHLENINLLITIVIIISALVMINNRVLIVYYYSRHPRDPWPGEYMRKCMEVYFGRDYGGRDKFRYEDV